MRKSKDTKKYLSAVRPYGRPLWYAAALTGLMLFCFAPLSRTMEEDAAFSSVGTASAPPFDTAVPDTVPAEAVSNPELLTSPVFLMQGDRGEDVFRLQTWLTALGYDVGDLGGVYTLQTASAVRRFQQDSGLIGDGVCTAAVSYAAACLNSGRWEYGTETGEEQLCAALRDSGCWTEDDGTASASLSRDARLRNALILFQRTHGLYGTGEADYATLCALGLVRGADILAGSSDSGAAADAALFDLRCRQLAEALADYVLRYPAAYDLYTMTACAAVLCNRTEDVAFPAGFDAVCARGLSSDDEKRSGTSRLAIRADAVEQRSHDLLLIRAAEDALRAHRSSSGEDASRGALYVCPADRPLPQDARICIRTKHFVFFR